MTKTFKDNEDFIKTHNITCDVNKNYISLYMSLQKLLNILTNHCHGAS
jgi:hypothetical protein